MSIYESVPYTNFHDLNADWIINQTKAMSSEWQQTKQEWEHARDSIREELSKVIAELTDKGVLPFTMPEAYGAVGDGEHDDTAAVQAALDHGAICALTAGKRYKITAAVTVGDIGIMGNGGTILLDSADSCIVIHNPDHRCVIEDLTVDGGDNAADCIRIEMSRGTSLRDVRVYNFTEHGINAMQSASGSNFEVYLDRVYARNAAYHADCVGVYLRATDSHVHDTVTVNTCTGIVIGGGSNFVDSFHAWNYSGPYLADSVGAEILSGCIITNSHFDNCAVGIDVTQQSRLAMDNTVFSATDLTDSAIAIRVYSTSEYNYVHMRNCFFRSGKYLTMPAASYIADFESSNFVTGNYENVPGSLQEVAFTPSADVEVHNSKCVVNPDGSKYLHIEVTVPDTAGTGNVRVGSIPTIAHARPGYITTAATRNSRYAYESNLSVYAYVGQGAVEVRKPDAAHRYFELTAVYY